MSAAELLADLNVGPNKPLGYLPCDTIRDLCHKNVHALQKELEAKGNKTLFLTFPAETDVVYNALYVWHEPSLKAKLESGREILEAVGLSTDCEDYVRKIALYSYLTHPVYGFIAETFGQPFRRPLSDRC